MDVSDSPEFPGPATLWDILISDCKGETACSEQNEAADGSSDASATDQAIQEESDTSQSGGSADRPLAGPAILWGILLSEAHLAACEVLDASAIINLWLAAGYDCELPLLEDKAPTLPAIDGIPTTDEEPPRPPPPEPTGPYTIKASPGKGQGIFTSRFVSAGSLILVDKPFLLVPKPYNNLKVLSAFECMPLLNRKLYMQLSCPDRSSFSSANDIHTTDVMRIFEANCFNLGDHAAVFLTATRFNHFCLPNTYYSWSDTRHEIAFHSMVDVSQGEELTICYGRPFRTRLERRSELRIYNFCCSCPACRPETRFGQASEARRLEMRALDEQIAMYQSQHDEASMSYELQDPLTAILRLIELIKEEELHGESMTPYRDAADLLKARRKFEEALVFAHLELEEEVLCLGADSEVVGQTREYIGDLEVALKTEVEETKRRELELDNEAVNHPQELENSFKDQSQLQQTKIPHEDPPHTHHRSHPQQPHHHAFAIEQPGTTLEAEPSETEPSTQGADIPDSESAPKHENAGYGTTTRMPAESQCSSARLVRSK